MIIPSYNYGRYLRRAIESVLDQRGPGVEVWVIDDGSTDDSPRIAESYAPAVRYVAQAHAGPYAACKRGIELAGSDHVLFLDADDRLADGAMERIGRALDREPEAGVFFGGVVNVFPDGRRLVSAPPTPVGRPRENFRAYCHGRMPISAGGAVVHRRVFDPFMARPDAMPHGMDRVIIARALALFPCRRIEGEVIEVYHHDGRLRDNAESVASAGAAAADWLFRPDVLPPEALRYRRLFLGRLHREHMRVFYRAGRDAEAVRAYLSAVRADPRCLLDAKSLKRFVVTSARRVARSFSPGGRASSGVPAVRAAEPPGHWLLGHRVPLLRDPIPFVLDCAARYGDVVRLRPGRATYLLSHPADIKHVLAGNPLNYHKSGFETAFREYAPEGLPLTESDRHRRDRKAAAPHFRPPVLNERVPRIARHVTAHARSWGEGGTINLAADMMRWSSESQAYFAFGVEDPREAAELFGLVRAAHRMLVRQTRSFLPVPPTAPNKAGRRYRRSMAQIHRAIHDLLRHRKPSLEGDASMLSLLLGLRASGDLPLRDEQIVDVALSTFLPYDPLANTFAWACHLLGHHPDAQDRLLDEARGALGGRSPEPDDMARLPYAHMVVDETLRLYPTVWMLARRVVADDRLPGGFTLPRGADVWISTLVVHGDPRWHEEPARFRPERFEASRASARPLYSYLPFGGGPRICIGNYLTRMTLAAALASLVPRYKFEPSGEGEVEIETTNGFVMQPKGGRLMVKISRR